MKNLYLSIESATFDAEKNEVILNTIDLDDVILKPWDDEFSASPITLRFDLSARAPRIYLYKLIRSVVKSDFSTLAEAVSKLPGKITNCSSNFVLKAED